MKFTTIVIIQSDNKTLDNIRKKVNEKSKKYLSEEMMNSICSLSNIDILDNQAIAEKLSEINQSETGVDDKGIYELSFVFKDALINQCQHKIDKPLKRLNFVDWYDIFDLQMTADLIINVDQYDRFPDSIIKPDFQLVRAPKAFMYSDVTRAENHDLISWKNDFKDILKKYSDNSFSLILSCHV